MNWGIIAVVMGIMDYVFSVLLKSVIDITLSMIGWT